MCLLCYLVPFVFLWYSLQNSLPSKYLWDFFAVASFWLFIVWPFLSVILQSYFCWSFFSVLRASCKTFIGLNALLLCTWFSSHFIFFCFVQTRVPQLKHLLAVLVPPLFHLIRRHLLPPVFLSSVLRGNLLGCLINSLYLARAIFTSLCFSWARGVEKVDNDYQVMTTWSYWQLLSNEENLVWKLKCKTRLTAWWDKTT